jgi:hypothetical protein
MRKARDTQPTKTGGQYARKWEKSMVVFGIRFPTVAEHSAVLAKAAKLIDIEWGPTILCARFLNSKRLNPAGLCLARILARSSWK